MAPAGSGTRRDVPGDLDRLRAATRGDLAAFESVARTRLPVAFRLGCAMLGDPAKAADAAQDALVAAWRELPHLADVATFDDWFRRIVIDECRMELRQKGPSATVGGDPPPGAPPAAVNPELAWMVERAIRIDALEAAFERLDPDERAVLVLNAVEHRPPVAIANLLRMPAGTADWHLREARQALERARARLPGAEPLDDLVERLFRRRAGEPMPDGLLDRSMQAVARERQARPGRRRVPGPRVGSGRVALGVVLAVVLVAVPATALLVATSGRLGGSPADDPASPPVAASPVVDPATGSPGPSGAATGATPPMTATSLEPGALAVVTRAGDPLRVRSKPGLGDDSIKLEPLLRTGARMYVLDGPVEADTYAWYLVQVYRGTQPLFGWVASGKDGEAWVRPRPLACQPEPDEHALATMLPLEFLACFGNRQLAFEADVRRVAAPAVGEACALAGGEGVCIEGPAWLLPDPGVLSAVLDRGSGSTRQVGVHVRPNDADLVAGIDTARPMRLTGSMDAPEAGDCRVTDADGVDLVPREEVVLQCRTRFVVSDAEPID